MERLFHIKANGTTFSKEILAGLTTFFTMAYIVIIAPNMLAGTGMPHKSVFVSVCVISACASALSGLLSNLPIALAPGLGLLSYFTYVVVGQLHYSWQAALGAVLISGLLFFFLTATRVRQLILKAIPKSLGHAIAAGIGFFIGFIALRNVGVVVSNQHTLVALGHLATPAIGLFFLGFLVIAALDGLKIPGSILIGIIVISLVGALLSVSHLNIGLSVPTLPKETFWAFEVRPLWNLAAAPVIFTFIIVALFDSTGTLIGLTHQLECKSEQDKENRINKALFAESIATIFSAIMGASTACPFIESSSGIRAGGRTGMTGIVVAILFLGALFFLPIAGSIPVYATSAALFYVACLMVRPFAEVNWQDTTDFVPAVITLLTIPLTFSIADGVGLGLICYVVLKVAHGKIRQLHPLLWLLTAVFVAFFFV